MPSVTIAVTLDKKLETKMSNPFFLIAGPCAIEDEATAFKIAEHAKTVCDKHGIELIFKGSYKKANRSKLSSFTGIGDEKALKILQKVGKELRVDTITDVHESHEPKMVSEYVTHLQIPAFLCRQTDLLVAAGETGCTVNLKKGQFLSPEALSFGLEKIKSSGNEKVWLCERGTTFGYSDLIVDATSIVRLKAHGAPVVMDCTHAVQKPNTTSGVTGGDPDMIGTLAVHAIATGADGLFMEIHPDPKSALSDPMTMLQMDRLEAIIEKCVRVKAAVS